MLEVKLPAGKSYINNMDVILLLKFWSPLIVIKGSYFILKCILWLNFVPKLKDIIFIFFKINSVFSKRTDIISLFILEIF